MFKKCQTETLTLVFDSPEAAQCFIGWWLDGGGEQEANFDTDKFDVENGYLRINGTGLDNYEEDE